MVQIGLEIVFLQKIISKRIQNFNIRVNDFVAFPTNQVNMRSMLESGVNDLTFAEIVPAGKSFLPEQIQGTVNSGKIYRPGVDLKLFSYLFGSNMARAVGNRLNDHFPLGSDAVPSLS